MTYFVTLTAQDGADIYYEIAEGADKAAVPTTASKKFDTYQYRQIEITQPTASAKGPVTKTYNVKAVAVKNGRTSSVANWNYDVIQHPAPRTEGWRTEGLERQRRSERNAHSGLRQR